MRREDIMIENAIYSILDKNPFIGNMLQLLNIRVSNQLPTAGVMFNPKSKTFEMLINKQFFSDLSTEERGAVFMHELYHILHKHLTSIHYSRYSASSDAKLKWNIAMDLSINQLIPNLPKQAMTLEMFKDKNGKDLKPEMSFEYYEDAIDWDKAKKDHGSKGDPNCPVHGNGASQDASGQEQGENEGEGEGSGQSNQHEHSQSGKQCSCKGGLFPLDDHDLMSASQSNASDEEMMGAINDLMKRTQQKSQYGYSQTPKFIQDLMNEIDRRLSTIDYKKLLSKVLRKSVAADDRQSTWLRPSKRYGYQASGTKNAEAPKVTIFLDTSGSISVDELNEFMNEVDAILKNTKSVVDVTLFHTTPYFTTKFRRGQGVEKLSLQSGGTDLQGCFDQLDKKSVDVVVFLTDGHYSDCDVKKSLHYTPIFVISKNGTTEHPLKRLGTTIKIS